MKNITLLLSGAILGGIVAGCLGFAMGSFLYSPSMSQAPKYHFNGRSPGQVQPFEGYPVENNGLRLLCEMDEKGCKEPLPKIYRMNHDRDHHSIPEPGTVFLLAAGVAAMTTLRRNA